MKCGLAFDDARKSCAAVDSPVYFTKLTLRDVNDAPPDHRPPDDTPTTASSISTALLVVPAPDNHSTESSTSDIIPAFEKPGELTGSKFRGRLAEARDAWLARSASAQTRDCYARDLQQFLAFVGGSNELESLLTIRPAQVAAWRDHLRERGLANVSILRKLTVLRSLFSYLQTYGYTGANPAHSHFVQAPSVPRDGKTVGLSPQDCRRLLESPDNDTPVGSRDRAILGVLAYSACRVGELARLGVRDFKETGGHKVLELFGKGGKERRVPLHPEAVERILAWFDLAGLHDDPHGPMFRATATARGRGRDGFKTTPLSKRAIQSLVKQYARELGLDPAVTVHSLRVTALTTGRERGADIIDLQDFAGHADPRTTLTYIRSRDRLSKSPAYTLRY